MDTSSQMSTHVERKWGIIKIMLDILDVTTYIYIYQVADLLQFVNC